MLCGDMNGFEAMKKIQHVDLSYNAKLYGKLPLKLYGKWVKDRLRLISEGTGIGRLELGANDEDELTRQISKEEDVLGNDDLDTPINIELWHEKEVTTDSLPSPTNMQFQVLQRLLLLQKSRYGVSLSQVKSSPQAPTSSSLNQQKEEISAQALKTVSTIASANSLAISQRLISRKLSSKGHSDNTQLTVDIHDLHDDED